MHTLARGLEARLALGVVLARQLRVVPLAAVGLETRRLSGQRKSGTVRSAGDDDRAVDVGPREAAAVEQVEHDVLELGAGRDVAVAEDAHDRARRPYARGPR